MELGEVASRSQADRAPGPSGSGVRFPLVVSFAAMTFAPQTYLHDAHGQLLGYATRNALFPDRTLVIYADESRTTPIYELRIVSVPEFEYTFHDTAGVALGGISRSPQRDSFLVRVDDQVRYAFVDETPLVEGIDALVPVIPILNALVGVALAPRWLATSREGGGPVLRISKRRTMMEAEYRLDLLGEIDARGRECILLAALMMIFRERLVLA